MEANQEEVVEEMIDDWKKDHFHISSLTWAQIVQRREPPSLLIVEFYTVYSIYVNELIDLD